MTDFNRRDPFEHLEGCMEEDIEKLISSEVIHDFKNILTGIMGNLSMAKDWSDPNDQAYPFIVAAERVTKHANQLALQLLASARGGERQHFDFSLVKIARDSADLMIGGSNCNFDIEVCENLKMVHGDQTRITQVLNNLLVNAKQAMPRGGNVTIRLENTTISPDAGFPLDPGEYVRVEIEDDGVGIADENLQKIFQMHFTTKKQGSGIGLSSCMHIVKQHGGMIHVESELGEGATFSIFLPALDKRDPEVVERKVADIDGNGCILVMDDELMVQQTIGDMLSIFGYETEFAGDGASAIECYKEACSKGMPHCLVIMDLTIPGGMGGLEAARRLREIDPGIKMVVSSGLPNDPAMMHYKDYGFIASIQKPYNLKDLQQMLADSIA